MAVTKILARHERMDVCINYVLNGDKTDNKILTAYQNVTEHNPYIAMKQTQERYADRRRKVENSVLFYHIIQSFDPGEILPEQALEIAKEFCAEYLSDYEVVMGTHIDKDHLHNHICFNAVSKFTGEKYHSSPTSYLKNIRELSDKLCAKYGLSIIMQSGRSKSMSYCEWKRSQSGQPTYRGMLEADIRQAIGRAADYGHFLTLMENAGYEVKHGKHIAFRLRGQDHYIHPGRKNADMTEDGIRAAIDHSLEAAVGDLYQPAIIARRDTPFIPKGKLTGFMALYVHYLYLLGKIKKQEYPPRMPPHLKNEIMKFERYKEQFRLLRVNKIETAEQLAEYRGGTENRLTALMKQRTILNTRKKKRKPLYDALATEQSLGPVAQLYADGVAGIEKEYGEYRAAVNLLDRARTPREVLSREKADIYESLAVVNREIRSLRHEISLCDSISGNTKKMKNSMESIDKQPKEVEKNRDKRR